MTFPALKCACGFCGDCATPVAGTASDAEPSPGDSITICIRCGRVYQLSLANAWAPYDVDELDAEQRAQVRRIQSMIHQRRGIPS